ncbi:MAG: diadenylate cyclase [Deltaproteobacteria bacterium]|nr:diadenylate cyclase [Deltaproteobacteria bacterium]
MTGIKNTMIDSIWTLLQSIRIQDIFDIAIISVMISALLIWFKDRASRFVLLGISLLGFIYIVAKFFQLYLTTVVLQGFFAILLFVLVVIFQEDLRRFFERLAILGIIRKKTPYTTPHEHTAEIITQTVADFARKRIGALIVIQGNDPLGRHLSGGTELNGVLSEPLLESIFDPHSIGHDGAVVIDGNTVVRFGCHLPLSQNIGSFGISGLRHTAALGLSERSDAICIVVSEERGTISITRREQIKEVASASALKGELESYYRSKTPLTKPGTVSLWLKENTKEKVIAIFLACVLWIIFGYQKESIYKDFSVPVEYLNVTSEWFIEEPKIRDAKIMLAGTSQAFQLLNTEALKVSLNLSQIQEGKQDVMLTKEMINTPSNISVVVIKPSRITVTASKFVRVSVPVEVVTENEPGPGIIVQKITASPSSLRVLVPTRQLRNDIKIKTAPIDLRALTSTTTFKPKLVIPPEVQFEGKKAPSIDVVIKIRR